MQKLLNDVGEVARKRLAHLRAGVFRRYVAAHHHQAVKRNEIPVFKLIGGSLALHEVEFQLGIVDESAKLLLLAHTESFAENFLHLALDCTRGVAEHVLKRLKLAVQIGKEMLGALGEIKDRLKIDYFGARSCNIRKIAGKQIEISQVAEHLLRVDSFVHNKSWSMVTGKNKIVTQ